VSSGVSLGLGFGGSWSSGGLSALGGLGSNTLGAFIQEAQLDDFLYSFGGPKKKAQAIQITASAELPGSTHWDPAPVPVGSSGGKPATPAVVVLEAGAKVPVLDILTGAFLPDFQNEGQPPIIFSPAPIILPGQVDPGREEQESEEGEMAHTWTHVGSQLLGALFPSTVAAQSFVAGPGQVGLGGNGAIPGGTSGAIPAPLGDPMYTGSCPPRKTRTLTIDCETGQEVKRKRRRRRALLTQGDMGVLFQIASLPNNANVRVALAGAIRR